MWGEKVGGWLEERVEAKMREISSLARSSDVGKLVPKKKRKSGKEKILGE